MCVCLLSVDTPCMDVCLVVRVGIFFVCIVLCACVFKDIFAIVFVIAYVCICVWNCMCF